MGVNKVELPEGWIWTSLDESCEVILGQSPPSSTYNTEGLGLPFYQGKAEFGALYPRPEKWCTAPKKIAQKDDVLMSVRAPVGPTNLCPEESCIGRGLAAIRPKDGMEPRYFLYYLRFIESDWDQKSTGTTFKAITGGVLKQLTIPLAPLHQQRRIVSKLEELLSKLDAAISEMRRVNKNLARYKASVLKAACEGRLVSTEAELARTEGRDYESGEELLQRILAERKKKWEEEQRAKGKDPSKMKYKEPEPPDMEDLPELPEGWVWAPLELLSWDSSYGTSQKCTYEADGPPVMRIPNIVKGSLDYSDVKFATKPKELNKEKAITTGDLLIIRTNGSRDLIGRSALVRDSSEEPIFFASYLIRYRIIQIDGLAPWINTIWDSYIIREWIERVAATTAGQYNVSVSKLNRLPIPLPSSNEQIRVIKEVERKLSIIQESEKTIEANLKRAGRLRQAVLKQAFEGKLVPRDL